MWLTLSTLSQPQYSFLIQEMIREQDVFKFYLSQLRVKIEQAFGMMVLSSEFSKP